MNKIKIKKKEKEQKQKRAEDVVQVVPHLEPSKLKTLSSNSSTEKKNQIDSKWIMDLNVSKGKW
jgi:hypothetical protein